jgi:hypothetical protein
MAACSHDVYRDGKVHVAADLCPTCIFRPKNLMDLRSGRVREMVDEAVANGSTIVCHATLDAEHQCACRGFYDRHATQPLQIAERLGLIEFQEVGHG